MHIVRDAAQKNKLSVVSKIVLEIGQFSGVEVDALKFALEIVSEGTILESTQIEILTRPLLLYCKDCEIEYLGEFQDLRCPICLGTQFDVRQGRELLIKSISGGQDDR